MKNAIAATCRLAALALIMVSPARADLIPKGARWITRCVRFQNLVDYPDHVFLGYFGRPRGGHVTFENDRCVTVDGKYRALHLAAIARTQLEGLQIPTDVPAEAAFFAGHPALIRSAIRVTGLDWVHRDDPRTRIEYVFRIVGVSPDKLRAEKLAVRYYYREGTSEDVPYANQDVAPPPRRPVPEVPQFGDSPAWRLGIPELAYYVALPIVALLGILFVLKRRREES